MNWNPQQNQYQQQAMPGARPGAPYPQMGKPATSSGKATTSMILGLGSLCLAFLLGIPAVIVGLLAMRDINRSNGRLGGSGLAITGIITGSVGTVFVTLIMACFVGPIMTALLLPAVQAARDAAQSQKARNDLKQIGLALHDHHDTHNSFPATGVEGESEAGAGLSWRVHLLPFLGHQTLYDRFHLDEPWDSPHNRSLLSEMPEVYASPAVPSTSYKTTYLAVVPGPATSAGTKTGLRPDEQGRFSDIVDGASNTILVVEADPNLAVEWTRPRDYPLDPNNPRHGLNYKFQGFNALFADGAVIPVGTDRDDEVVRAMLGANDGMPIY